MKKAMKISAITAAVLATATVALPFLIDVDGFRPQLESTLGSTLRREVHLGHMELSLLAGGARVEKISIADDLAFSKDAFLEAKSVGVGVSLFSLIFSRTLHVTSLTIEEPKMIAIKSAQGRWNFASIGSAKSSQQDTEASMASTSSAMSSVVLDHLKITNATIELGSGSHADQRATLKNVEVDLKNVSLESAMTFSLTAAAGEGKLKIEGNVGPIKESTDSDEKPAIVHMKIDGSRVPLDSVKIFLPALGIVLPGGSTLRGGTVNAKLALDGPIDRLTTSGNVEIAKAHLKGFDLSSKLSGLGSGASAVSDLAILNLSTRLRVSPEGTHVSGFNGQFAGIGGITGDGDVNASNHLQFKMVAHVPRDGALRFGMDHLGLKNVSNDIPFQVVGTTAMPIVIPEMSGLAKNSAKVAAASAGKSAMKKLAASNAATPQAANAKKSGFFHNLFHHKDKNSGTQLASQNTKF